MHKRCTVCNHPARVEIDQGLLNGVSYRALAAPYGLTPSALCRRLPYLPFFPFSRRRRVWYD